MDIRQQHEVFEIEVLDKLRRRRLLEPLVFEDGTMLRLCHELGRYSVDLDFWFITGEKEALMSRRKSPSPGSATARLR